jgi:D-amino-acid dehydrogenase
MSERSDVLIVGAGPIGACVAEAMTRDGASVVLVERELETAPPASAVHANCGLLVPSEVAPLAAPGALGQGLRWMLDRSSPFYIRPRVSPRLARWLWLFQRACRPAVAERAAPLLQRLGADSAALHDDFARERGERWLYRRNGLLQVYETQAGLEAAAVEAETARGLGVSAEVLTPSQAKAHMPCMIGDVRGAVFFADDGHLEPAAFTREMAALAAERGARVLTGTEALRLEQTGDGVEVLTTKGLLHAGQVVLAAGAWTPALARGLGLELPIEPAKGYSVDVERPADFPELPLYPGEARVVLTPLGDTLRLGSTLELAGWDTTVRLARVAHLRRAAQRLLGLPDDGPVRQIWRGPRPVTPDGMPVIGRAPRHDRVIVATGHAMLGLSLGPVTARLVAALAGGAQPAVDLAPLAPTRFRL